MTLTVDVEHSLGAFSLNASFTSDHGVTALFGRSGSGKTSVIRLIAGLEKPSKGRITFNGEVLADTKKNIFMPKHKRRFGYVFQEGRLFPHLSVRQNLNYGQWFLPKAERTGNLDNIISLLGIEKLLERRPNLLSGGEKQRVAIGRALLSSPRLLLMDEPLSALDHDRKEEILPYLERMRDEMNIPVVYVSHSISEVVRLADKVVMMSDGKVISTGTTAETLSHPSAAVATSNRQAGVLLEGKCTNYDDEHRLASISFNSEKLLVPAEKNILNQKIRVHIPARDVMLATANPVGISALNVLTGVVKSTNETSDNMIDVSIDCSGDVIRSRITRLSGDQLDIKQGKIVYAIIKTAALASD